MHSGILVIESSAAMSIMVRYYDKLETEITKIYVGLLIFLHTTHFDIVLIFLYVYLCNSAILMETIPFPFKSKKMSTISLCDVSKWRKIDEGDCCLNCICEMEEISGVMDAINIILYRLQRRTQVLKRYTRHQSSHVKDNI